MDRCHISKLNNKADRNPWNPESRSSTPETPVGNKHNLQYDDDSGRGNPLDTSTLTRSALVVSTLFPLQQNKLCGTSGMSPKPLHVDGPFVNFSRTGKSGVTALPMQSLVDLLTAGNVLFLVRAGQ
ncbi:hypothetical protein CBL_02784 [Carabus blaptoides fortunei]